MHKIAPSILSADFLRLGEEIEMINQSDADWFHLDVMDGRFVPNITFGLPVIAAMKKKATKPFDVHLMIVEPEKYFEEFAKAGADVLTVHYEVSPHLHRSLQVIKSLGMKAGVAINPHTPVHFLETVIADIDLVCLMSVNPGFGGQKFIDHTMTKLRLLKQMIKDKDAPTLIEIDGGVTLDNAAVLVKCGADVLVAGNTVFSSANPADTIKRLKQ
ncbi:MAG TPA: ribulose-phosphate 3-epimerase [Flavipsychrobacter sp.]|nr:ribulose-phosphate 3-epimerase [Flavipsychrobacter sp.]